MDISVSEPQDRLARIAQARSWQAERPVGAMQAEGGRAGTFIADEILVDASDQEAIERALEAGGRIVREVYDPELPDEFREAGLGRDEPLDMTDLPRSVKIRFERPPETADVRLEKYLERTEQRGRRLEFSDPRSQALAAFVAPFAAEGRGVSLNEIGRDDATLPLRNPTEAGGVVDAGAWPSMSGRFRIAQAWDLIGSLRFARSAGGLPFIAIVDSGFWFDAPTTPGSDGEASIRDLGTGGPRWNTVTDTGAIPSGPGRSNYHGTRVASAAAAAVGNNFGSAGSGGTVARLCYFHDDRSSDSAKTAMIRCAQWGIPFAVYSGGFSAPIEFFFDSDSWNRTFDWAADNGVLMVASAGNAGDRLPDDDNYRPASRTPRVLTVGATNDDGTMAGFSNRGPSVQLWAPGVGIPVGPTPTLTGGGTSNGTSFSAPLTAGVAAMVRFANPALSVDQVRNALVDTGWQGAGEVSKGIDAYAAVWWAMQSRMAESGTEAGETLLSPRADGTFEPYPTTAINRPGDVDTYLLDVATYSRAIFDVQWYRRLGGLTVTLENVDRDAPEPRHTTAVGAGSTVITAELGTGRYRLTIRGSRPTAYVLTGSRRAVTLGPDRFERNDSFDTAQRLRVAASEFTFESMFGPKGPGSFDLTLHTLGAGPGTTDVDFFRFDVPKLGVINVPKVRITSDEKVDVTLFAADRTEVAKATGKREVKWGLEQGKTVYLRVSGTTHTRYTLWTGLELNPAFFPEYEQELEIFPPWWDGPRPNWFDELFDRKGVIIDETVLGDGVLVLGSASGGVLPEDVRVELLDRTGATIREGEEVAGTRRIDVTGLEPGAFAVRVTTATGAPIAVQFEAPRELL